MTPPSPADRPGSAEPGTARLPWLGAPLVDPPGTGSGPVRRSRPAPPPAPSTPVATTPPAEPSPEDDEPPEELPTTEQPATGRAPGRAGRDLGAAIGVGLGLGAVIVGSLVLWRPSFLGVLVAAILVGVVELTRALRAGKFQAPLVPLLVGAVAMEALAWTRGSLGLVTGFLVTALAVLVWRLADGPVRYLRDAAAGVL